MKTQEINKCSFCGRNFDDNFTPTMPNNTPEEKCDEHYIAGHHIGLNLDSCSIEPTPPNKQPEAWELFENIAVKAWNEQFDAEFFCRLNELRHTDSRLQIDINVFAHKIITQLLHSQRASDVRRLKEEREKVIEECVVAIWQAWGSHDDAMEDTETSRTFSKAIKTIRALKVPALLTDNK